MNNNGNELSPDESYIRPLDSEFVGNLNRIKNQLYERTVFGPPLNAPESQDNAVLNKYLGQLNVLYDLSRQAQSGRMPYTSLEPFPKELHREIETILQWIARYFQQNGPNQTIPYTHYLESTLRVYPFVQHSHLAYKDVEMTDEMDYSSNTL
jgi:hypothetical protein